MSHSTNGLAYNPPEKSWISHPLCYEALRPIRLNIEKSIVERHYEREASSQGAREFLSGLRFECLFSILALDWPCVTQPLHHRAADIANSMSVNVMIEQTPTTVEKPDFEIQLFFQEGCSISISISIV